MKNKAVALYKYLLDHPDGYVSEEEICTQLSEFFPANTRRLGHTTLNRKIWDVVQFINDTTDEFPMIVLNNRKRKYKIATERDLKVYLGHEHKLLSKKYKRLKKITQKASLNGIADLTSYDNDELKFLKTILDSRGDENASQTS